MLSVEVGAPYPSDVNTAEKAILEEWQQAAAILPSALQPPQWQAAAPGSQIATELGKWAQASPRPLCGLN